MASVYSVSQVNAYIKNLFVQDFLLNRIGVKGEVSNCKYHPSGHIYFTLKDGSGTLSAVMFASKRSGLKFQLAEGQQVVVKGSIDIYERDGRYQMYASEVTLDGRGDLFLKFEQLRDELEEMGMFAPEYKQPIPKYATKIGIVTASTGAAIRDIMNIANRRNPYVQLVLYPALVQGIYAKQSIVDGIETLDQMGLDVIIVGRGGGSIEDLWAFNEEIVARAIFDCNTPIISAVGHETDVTIADYVADMRAPTPSAAAELAVFDYRQWLEQVRSYQYTLQRGMERELERTIMRLKQSELQLNYYDPKRQVNEKRQRLVDIELQLQASMEKKLLTQKHRLALLSGRLHGLSPLEKIKKGFGFLTNDENKKIESVKDTKQGDTIHIRVHDGMICSVVADVKEQR